MACDYYCQDGDCRPYSTRCPGDHEVCAYGFTQCDSGSLACYRDSYRCDGSWDCVGGEDEQGCPFSTSPPSVHTEGRSTGAYSAVIIGAIIPIFAIIFLMCIIVCCVVRRRSRYTQTRQHVVTAGVPQPPRAGAPPPSQATPTGYPVQPSVTYPPSTNVILSQHPPPSAPESMEPPPYHEAISMPEK